MANLKVGNTTIGKIAVIEPYEDVYVDNTVSEPWVRPSEWLDMPVIGSGDDKVAILVYVPSGRKYEAKIYANGTYVSNYDRPTYYTVDWGDGNTTLVSGNYPSTTHVNGIQHAYHEYDYNDLSPDSEFIYQGVLCRQAIVQMDNSVSGCYNLDLSGFGPTNYEQNAHDANVRRGANHVLDIHVASQNLTYLKFYDNYKPRFRNLERIKIDSPRSIASMYQMFYQCESLRLAMLPSGFTTGVTDFRYTFALCEKLQEVPYLDTSSATLMGDMFNRCYSLEKIPDMDTTNVTHFQNFAVRCYDLKEIPNLDYRNSYMREAFTYCRKIKSIPSGVSFHNCSSLYGTFNLCDLQALPNDIWERCSGVPDMVAAFSNNNNLRSVPKVNIPDCTVGYSMFAGCSKLESVELGDVSNIQVTGFVSMFNGCNSLRSVTFDDPENIKADSTNSMFYRCLSLEQAPYFNTSGVTDARYMFNGCYNLKSIPAYDFSNLSTVGMTNFAYDCRSLKHFGGFRGINSNIRVDASFMYSDSLKEFPSGIFISQDTCPATGSQFIRQSYGVRSAPHIYASGNSANSMFYEAYSLRYIDGVTFGAETNCYRMFYSCQNLNRFPEADGSLITNATDMFLSCVELEWSDLNNVGVSISYRSNFLASGAIENIFNRLASGVAGQSIDIVGNYGTSELHSDTLAIATSKGWTVTT